VTDMAAPSGFEAHVGTDVFSNIVVGIEGTAASIEACRQVRRLHAPGGAVEAFMADYLAGAVSTGWSATRIGAELEAEAQVALDDAVGVLGAGATARFVNGRPEDALLHELQRCQATLAAVGSHGHSRSSEIVLGGVAGRVLHDAPCSVLVARPSPLDGPFPRAVLVGVDGSDASLAALAVAQDLAARFDASLRVVAAAQGKGVDLARARAGWPGLEVADAHPLDALVNRAPAADLVVVGSRGLHGLRSLGSVSERVAHEARPSVLVVRPPEA
jgi:nucleotide-binding universal stress UspA family protein